jgi:uncharacterized repeat protein (TIGR03803 family)
MNLVKIFCSPELNTPRRIQMRKLRLLTLAMFVLAVALAAHAQSQFSLLYTLGTNTGDPAFPYWIGAFAQGRDGNLYSTSQNGGSTNNCGTVFQLTPAGKMKVLHSFDPSACQPWSGLTLGTDGYLYGTTAAGVFGPHNDGTIFRISTGRTFQILHNFTGVDGTTPYAPPIQGTDGNFYGTTEYSPHGNGTVYKLMPSSTTPWLLRPLHDFGSIDAVHLGFPGALVQGTDGNLYGTTQGAGSNPYGAIFVISRDGKFFKVLHSFTGGTMDGQKPLGSIIQTSDGNFYGTTQYGGLHNFGTIYQMTPAGVVNVIFSFDAAGGLGYRPFAGLVQATDGNLYGGTYGGTGLGFYRGLLFSFQVATRKYSVLYNFIAKPNSPDPGSHPLVPLFQHTNGTFYSDTYEAGAHSQGTLYSLKTGLHPFVALLTTSGKANQVIEIIGNGLTGTSSVKFNGVVASFKVTGDTYMTAVVPATATTGYVTVATPSGSRVSSKIFTVLP